MTVRELVNELKAAGVQFELQGGLAIRTDRYQTVYDGPCCPIIALCGVRGSDTTKLANSHASNTDIRAFLGLDRDTALQIVESADWRFDDCRKILEELLTSDPVSV